MLGTLFSFRGGSGRLFLLGTLFFWLLALTAAALLLFIYIDRPVIGGTTFVVTSLLSFFSLWAISVRRFHDMGLSGWWVIFIYLMMYAPPYTLGIYDQMNGGEILRELSQGGGVIMDNKTILAAGIVSATSIVSLIFLIIILCIPGKHDDNPYIID